MSHVPMKPRGCCAAVLGPALAILVSLWLPLGAQACPDAVLGSDTSTAYLTALDYSEDGDQYRLVLDLTVIDQPLARTIQVAGEPVIARVEHFTPLSLARWVKNVTMQAGGTSKFVLGALVDPETGDVAVIPYSAIRSVAVSQGDDFNSNAPFQVRLELMLLHRLDPFEGGRTAFEPLTGLYELGEHYIELMPNESTDQFDPYGQSFGDYFADRDLVVSFVHGPVSPGSHTSPDHPKPHTVNGGLPYPTVSRPRKGPKQTQEGSRPRDGEVLDLYAYVTQVYSKVQPNTTARDMVGRQILLAVVGDRSWTPPSSPYSQYRPTSEFVHGRRAHASAKPDGLIPRLIDRSVPGGPNPWRSRNARKPQRRPGPGIATASAVVVLALGVYVARRRVNGAGT